MAEPRIAVVGCGGMGHNHTRAAVQELGARVVGGCDISPEARERYRQAWGTDAVYESWDELYDRTRPDVVFVTTHGSFHAPATIAAAESGFNVFCEKPMALSLADCDAMIEACDRNGVKLAINHIKRASGYNGLVRHLIASGDIGEVFAIQAYNKGARPSATEMTEMGTHIADWARVFAPDVQWAHGHVTVGGREATAADIRPSTEIHGRHVDSGTVMGERMFATYGAAGGINISINFWMEADNDDRSYGLDIFGTRGRYALRQSVNTNLYRHYGSHMSPVYNHQWEHVPMASEDAPNGVPLTKAEARDRLQGIMFRELWEAIQEDRDPESSGREGRAAMEMMHAAWESHRRRARVDLPMTVRENPLDVWAADAARDAG